MIRERPQKLESWLAKPVAVLGHGVSGQAAFRLLHTMGARVVMYDERAPAAQPNFTLTTARAHALVVVSPGFAIGHPWLEAAREAGCRLLGECDLGALCWQGELLAVTGTNGKSTLVTLLTDAYREAGYHAVAAGNIGKPLSQACLERHTSSSVAVCEVSSFQAELLSELQPDAVLWTTFAEDHLDRHANLETYFRAKWRLVTSAGSAPVILTKAVAQKALTYGLALPESSLIVSDVATQRYPGGFSAMPNRINYVLASQYWQQRGLPMLALETAAMAYEPLPHRCQLVRSVGNCRFWDDSKATNFEATLAAAAGFKQPIYWIGGGRNKGGDIGEFCQKLAPNLAGAVVLGETAPVLVGHLQALACPTKAVATLLEAVTQAHLMARVRGGDILLSPGFASQDMFRGYDERGRIFTKAVFDLKAETSPVNTFGEKVITLPRPA